MKLATQATLALVLLVLGAVLWFAGTRQARTAEAQRALMTFDYEAAAGIPATDYWSGAYQAITPERDPLLAANAAYRAATDEGGDWRAVTNRLDQVITQYADVLRDDPGSAIAAYNYEFVVRYRNAIAARQQPVPAAVDAGDTSLHGRIGAPPPGANTKQFKMIVPMRPDERQEAEEAGRGGRRVRKG